MRQKELEYGDWHSARYRELSPTARVEKQCALTRTPIPGIPYPYNNYARPPRKYQSGYLVVLREDIKGAKERIVYIKAYGHNRGRMFIMYEKQIRYLQEGAETALAVASNVGAQNEPQT